MGNWASFTCTGLVFSVLVLSVSSAEPLAEIGLSYLYRSSAGPDPRYSSPVTSGTRIRKGSSTLHTVRLRTRILLNEDGELQLAGAVIRGQFGNSIFISTQIQ